MAEVKLEALIKVESCKIRAVVVKIKYITVQHITVHAEYCKIELQLDVSISKVIKNIRTMCRIEESSKRKGFADFCMEVFYIDVVETGNSRKASVKVVQREVVFEGFCKCCISTKIWKCGQCARCIY
jgi:hypothetical protein